MDLNKDNQHYTRKELDQIALAAIEHGKDIEFYVDGEKYRLDIKTYTALMKFSRPDLFNKDGKN